MAKTSQNPLAPEAKGQRTLMDTLLALSESYPNRIYGSYPLTDDVNDGFRDFTVSEFVRAVDRCAWFIKKSFGLCKTYETVLYQGASDFRYAIVLFAAIKCGYKAYYQNPKNPFDQNLAMLDAIQCQKALYSVERRDLIDKYELARPHFKAFEIASLNDLLESTEVEPFPWKTKPWDEAKHDPIIVLHSSGTTGAPKPIVYQNGTLRSVDSVWPDGAGAMRISDKLNGAFAYAAFPVFHLGGFHFYSVIPVFSHCTPVMAPAAAIPALNGPLALQILKTKNVQMMSGPPVLFTEIARCDGGIDALARLRCVVYGGGPLRSDVGNELSARGLNLIAVYGSTELTWLPALSPTPQDWEWLHFHPAARIEWVRSEDDSERYELCLKDEGPTMNELRATHWTVKTDDWRSKDLFIRHPSKPDLWKFSGRTDDILVLASSAKVNPIPGEDVLHSHPLISGAMMAGEHRWPPCFLIEPRDQVADVDSFRRDIWPTIEKANELVREDSRVPYENVIVLPPGSFERSPKGSIMRHRSAKQNAERIASLYSKS